MSTSSRCLSFGLNACCRKSLDVSTIKVCPPCSIRTETRRRLSRGSSEVQVSQSQAIEGTPVEVPVPKKVSFIEGQKRPFDICDFRFVICYFALKSVACCIKIVVRNSQMRDVK